MSPKNRIAKVGILTLPLVLLLTIGAPGATAQVQIFKAPQAFPAGPNPVAQVSGDFNGDGKMDVAVANSSSATVSVMLGNGDGTFRTPAGFAVGNGPSAIVAGDFDGDGKLDLAVANSTDGTVSILLGKGDGTFQTAVNYAATAGATWMTVGSDFNGNGKLDLAVGSSLTMSVLVGNGDGTFQLAGSYQTGFPVSCDAHHNCRGQGSDGIAVGDLNGDGKLDLVLAAGIFQQECTPGGCRLSTSGFLEFFAGNGDGSFQNYTAGCSYSAGMASPVVADFNGDGKLDVAVNAGSVAVCLGNGDGTFQPPTPYGGGPGPLAVADLNGDGKLDLAVGSQFTPGGVSVLLGNGDGTFQTAVGYAAGPFQSGIAIGDFNGDGRADLAVANNVTQGAVTVLLGNGDGTFGPEVPEFQLAARSPSSVAAGDFNGDGKLDFVVVDVMENGGFPGISVLLRNGDATFQPANFIAITQGNPVSVAAGDFNGDNKLDLVLGNGGTGLMVLLGNGDGTFQPPVSYSTPYSVAYPSIAIGDFNGDNKSDLAMADGFGHVDILLGNGDGTFQGAVTYSSGQACDPNSVLICMEMLAAGDFNGDGKLDLAVPDVAGNTVNILFGNGDGTFQTPVTYPVGSQPTVVAVDDFNGDGKLDLALGNNAGSTISILLGKGDGTFQPAANYPVAAAGPGEIVIGDFNGDGILDVAAQGNGLASVLLGKGDGTFQPQLNYAFGGAQPGNGIVAGDFDGDYTTDLVLIGGLGGTTASVLFNLAGFYLSVTESGTGAGTLTSVPSGINCSSTCSARFAGGATVTLRATPNSISNFIGWSGACSSTGTCTVTMKAAESVTATFTLQDFSLSAASAKLSLQPGGQGTDVITIAGLNGPFSNAIGLTCAISGPAPQPTCGLSAATVTPTASATSTLTITAPASVAAMQNPAGHWQLSRLLYALWLPLMFGITIAGGSRKLRRGYSGLCGFLLLLFFVQTACGGGNSTNISTGTGTPPPTNYTVTVTGTSAAIQHMTQVAVTVQ